MDARAIFSCRHPVNARYSFDLASRLDLADDLQSRTVMQALWNSNVAANRCLACRDAPVVHVQAFEGKHLFPVFRGGKVEPDLVAKRYPPPFSAAGRRRRSIHLNSESSGNVPDCSRGNAQDGSFPRSARETTREPASAAKVEIKMES